MNKNIYEYLNYYKDYSFDEILFNVMDALLFSILIYLPLENVSEDVLLEDLNKYINKYEHGAIAPIALEIYRKVYSSKRYKKLIISNISKINNNSLQFGAFTIRDENNTYVVYEGTNASVSGWMENFMLSCKFPTSTQEYAAKYLNETIKNSDKNIYVCGHSKGGNLAMASSMMCSNSIFKRIKKIYNFDGPGFRRKEYLSKKFKEVNEKTVNILPEGSIVGVLLFNDNYTYIKAKGIGFKQHYPTNWDVFGQFFVKTNLIITSRKFKESIDKSLFKLKDDDMLKILDEVNVFLESNNIYQKGFNNINFNDFKKMVLDINGVDESTKKAFIDIIKLMFNPEKNK